MTETTNDDKPKSKMKLSKLQKHLIIFALGLVVAFIAITAVRFAAIKSEAVHYHANFALYINGQKDEFKSFTFYEEVASCNVHDGEDPKARTHMHDSKAGLIHVHDGGVTWGQFFENLGYTLGDDIVATDKTAFVNGAEAKNLTFILNGEAVSSIANKVIHSEDTLLVNYGGDNEQTLKSRYNEIPHTAGKANQTKDPSACSGADELTFVDKLKQAIGLPKSED